MRALRHGGVQLPPGEDDRRGRGRDGHHARPRRCRSPARVPQPRHTRDPAGCPAPTPGAWYHEQHELGFNYRLSDIHSALGRSQLGKLERFVAAPQRRSRSATATGSPTSTSSSCRPRRRGRPSTPTTSSSSATATAPGRAGALFDGLREREILRPGPLLPVYLHPYYRETYGYEPGICPAAERYYAGCLSLPVLPGRSSRATSDESWPTRFGSARPMSFPPEFRIGGRAVGGDHPTYVIAEAGANHNRDLDTARRADRRRRRGRRRRGQVPDLLRASGSTRRRRRSSSTWRAISDKSPAELLEEISLPREWQADLADYAQSAGSTSSHRRSTTRRWRELDALDVPVLKIASFEIVDLPLIAGCRGDGAAAADLNRDGDARRDRGGADARPREAAAPAQSG